MHCVQELHLCLFSFLAEYNSTEVISNSLISSTFSVYSSTNLSTNLFLYLQFWLSKYSLKSDGLSHSHSQLLGFQIDPLSHAPLSINSLLSYLNLSSFQRCLLLQTLSSNPHLHLHVSCHSMSYFISSWHQIKYFNIQIFNNIGNIQFCRWIIDIITTTTAFTCFNTKRKKHRIIRININNLWSYFTFLIVHWITAQRIYAC